MTLAPCPRCHRHVREPACPFCDHAVGTAAPRAPLVGRLGRAAVFAGAALTGCWTSSAPHHTSPLGTPLDTTTTVHADGTATLHGTITTNGGEPVAQTPVHLAGGKVTRTVHTDANGRYEMRGLPAGTYQVTVDTGPAIDNPSGWNTRTPDGAQQTQRTVALADGAAITLDIVIVPPVDVIDRNACCMPYGAPPRRTRVV